MSIPKPPKDKRTKAYKQWKAKYEASPEGMGDVVREDYQSYRHKGCG